jgi:hypothetical protein
VAEVCTQVASSAKDACSWMPWNCSETTGRAFPLVPVNQKGKGT